MSTRTVVFGSALLLPLLAAAPAQAQRVAADIRIGGGPIRGHVVIGSQDRFDSRWDREYRSRRVRVEVIGRRDRGWFGRFRREARVVVVYYDRRDDCYYDRFRSGLQEIRVYERDGRFYRADGDRDDGRFYDDRYDDRRDREFDRNRDRDHH